MYVLYYSPGAASFAVHWLLIELGVPFEARRLDIDAQEHKGPEYLALNPNGLVPTLLIEGKPVFESAALLTLLAERHPEAKFSPPPGAAERTNYVQWMFHLSNTLQPAFRDWFYPEGAAGPANVEAAKATVARTSKPPGIESNPISRRPAVNVGIVQRARFPATILMRWSRNMPRPATTWPEIAAYVARMKARPPSGSCTRERGSRSGAERAPPEKWL